MTVDPPHVRLAGCGPQRSIAATVYALLDRGAAMRPELARELRGCVVLRFEEDYRPVRLDFLGEEILVADGEAAEPDLVVSGSLPDVVAVVAAPLAAGVPSPRRREGRAALARLVDGRVDFDGPLGLARRLVRLMAIDPEV